MESHQQRNRAINNSKKVVIKLMRRDLKDREMKIQIISQRMMFKISKLLL